MLSLRLIRFKLSRRQERTKQFSHRLAKSGEAADVEEFHAQASAVPDKSLGRQSKAYQPFGARTPRTHQHPSSYRKLNFSHQAKQYLGVFVHRPNFIQADSVNAMACQAAEGEKWL